MRILFLFVGLLFLNSLALAAGGGAGGNRPFEVRAHFGMNTLTSKAFDDKMETILNGVPDIKSPQLSGIDFTYQLDQIVLGLRFELATSKDSTYSRQSGVGSPIKKIETEFNANRGGILLGWRPVRIASGYLGIMSHYMPMNSLDFNIKAQNTTTNAIENFKYTGSNDAGYGAGLDAGFYIQDKFKAGIEIGYTKFESKTFTDSSGTKLTDSAGNDVGLNLSGTYGKFLLGATF